jgi:hypothetical protein
MMKESGNEKMLPTVLKVALSNHRRCALIAVASACPSVPYLIYGYPSSKND